MVFDPEPAHHDSSSSEPEHSSTWTGRRLHFVGIGGAGMSGLALIAVELGASVTGSDARETPYMGRLRERGVQPAIGYRAENVPAGAEIVYSTAVDAANPERNVAPRELHRADLLAEIASLKRCIAVTGTHGKTTTTAMIAHILRGSGMDPGYVIGGELLATGANAGWGDGEWIVVEADESDRSLLKLSPEIALLTNAELDHHSTYASLQDVRDTFRSFLGSARRAVVWDRPELVALAPDPAAALRFDARDPVLQPTGARFAWEGRGVTLRVPGAHNAVNAAGALAAAVLAGVDADAAVAAIASFTGARRRLERLGTTAGGSIVFDDYAHHPTEVASAVAAARTVAEGRVVALFQPHLFSRTRALAREFGIALAAADVAAVLEIYPARERAEEHPGVSGLAVAQAAADAGAGRPVAWLPGFAEARAFLDATLRAGDLCLLMGAGNIDSLGRELVGGRAE
jgi:UDP-N-acetylmuramate--alanine ligase